MYRLLRWTSAVVLSIAACLLAACGQVAVQRRSSSTAPKVEPVGTPASSA